MEPERPSVEERLDALGRRLEAVERRLHALEHPFSRPPRTEAEAEADAAREAAAGAAAPSKDRPGLPLVGRTLLVMAGAFLLRAITEAQILPEGAGIAAGMVYAISWLLLAGRTIPRGLLASAAFHVLSASIIAFPLLWEATVRFKFLSPTASAAAIGAVAAVAFVVSLRTSHPLPAWVFTAGALLTSLGLAVTTRAPVPYLAVLLGTGLAALWLGYLRKWHGPGILAAAAFDGLAALLTLIVLLGRTGDAREVVNPVSLAFLLLVAVVGYLGSYGARAVSSDRNLSPAEVSQGIAVTAIGLAAAALLVRAGALPVVPVGGAALALAAACYGVGFTFIDKASGRRANFVLYTSLALAFALVGIGALLPEPGRSGILSTLAVAVAALGAFRARATLSLHGAIYAGSAVVASGLGAASALAFVARDPSAVPQASLPMLAALLASAACAFLPVAAHGRTLGRFTATPKVAVLALVALGLGYVAVRGALGLPFLAAEEGIDRGALAAARTAVIAVAAVALGALGRSRRFREAAWLVYPVLALGGAKLLLEDLRAGRALTLFVSLAFFGGALILAPRLRKFGDSNPISS